MSNAILMLNGQAIATVDRIRIDSKPWPTTIKGKKRCDTPEEKLERLREAISGWRHEADWHEEQRKLRPDHSMALVWQAKADKLRACAKSVEEIVGTKE